MTGPLLALHLDAGHNINGNPRRCYVIVRGDTGEIVETIDEGYRDAAAYQGKYPEANYVGRIPTTANYRRELLRG